MMARARPEVTRSTRLSPTPTRKISPRPFRSLVKKRLCPSAAQAGSWSGAG